MALVERIIVVDTFNARMVKRTPDDALSFVAKKGSSGSGDDQFSAPAHICNHGDYLYITDLSNQRIQKRSIHDISYIAKYGTGPGSGDTQFNQPSGICTDGAFLYISDNNNDRIKKHRCSNLAYVSKIGTAGSGNDQFQNPLAITTDGTYLYVADTSNNRIVKRLCSNLSYVSQIGTAGSGNDQFNFPSGIATDGTYLYVMDTWNHRIVKRLCSDLSYVSKIGAAGNGNDQFQNPYDVTVSIDGTQLYVADTGNNRVVKRLASDLSYVSQIGSTGSGDDQFSSPSGITFLTELVPMPGRTLLYAPYPDPSYPGEVGVTTRRFWIGPIHDGPWDYTPPPADDEYVYMNYQQPWQVNRSWDQYDADVSAINITDPNNSYMDVIEGPFSGQFPTWVSGSEIYQNLGFTWTTVLPWDPAERVFWIYPNPILTTTKIYYNNQSTNGLNFQHADFSWSVESAGAGNVPFTVNPSNPDVIWHYNFSDNMESVVTECGEDDNGTWIKVRPYTELGYVQIHVCAGNGLIVAPKSTEVQDRWVEVAPWGRKTRTGCIYVSDGPGHRIIQRETPGLIYMSDYTDSNINYPTGICNDGTYLYVLNHGNNLLLKYQLGDPNTGLASDLVYVDQIAIGTFPQGMVTDGSYLYYTANESGGYRVVKRNLDLSLVAYGSTTFSNVPKAITVDGSYIYVASAATLSDTSIDKFDKSTLDLVATSYIVDKVSGMCNDGTNMYIAMYDIVI